MCRRAGRTWPPAALAGVLERIHPEGLDDVGTIDYLQASAKTVAWLDQARVKALNRFTGLRPAEGAETGNAHGFSSCAATEIAAALALPRGSVLRPPPGTGPVPARGRGRGRDHGQCRGHVVVGDRGGVERGARRTRRWVLQARNADVSWAAIAAVLGVSKQVAH